jgi:ribonuclease HI
VITNPDSVLTKSVIHNQWLKAINAVLQRDRLLTDQIRFGALTLKKQLILNTWSGLLMDEDSLLDDWTHEGVLVGIWPITDRNGIG